MILFRDSGPGWMVHHLLIRTAMPKDLEEGYRNGHPTWRSHLSIRWWGIQFPWIRWSSILKIRHGRSRVALRLWWMKQMVLVMNRTISALHTTSSRMTVSYAYVVSQESGNLYFGRTTHRGPFVSTLDLRHFHGRMGMDPWWFETRILSLLKTIQVKTITDSSWFSCLGWQRWWRG